MSLSILLKSVFVVNIIFLENTLPSHSFERYENVVTPPQDRRQYRGLKLSNEMKVMLISDESTETSAASLVLGVGAFNDHQLVPGVVNLVGHVLLTGGGDNPSNFERFIESHQGTIVAPDTRETDQSFSFRVPHTYFSAALREFLQIFISPRVMHDSNPNVIRKAVQSVQREFSENARNEDKRIEEVEKLLSGDSYFINHLYCGCEETFYDTGQTAGDRKKNPKDKQNACLVRIVQIFFELWYSSNLMTLAVLGREPLDDLENMVVSLFENIKNINKPKITYPVGFNPWGPEQLRQRLCIVPQNLNVRTIILTFPAPNVRTHYDAAPENYVMHYILYAGHNTLVSVLRKRNLCTSVKFEYLPIASFAFVKLTFKVTERGVMAIDDIINLTFQYIHMLKDGGIETWMHRQLRMSYIRAFKHYNATPQEPLNYTLKIARNLQTVREIGDVLHEEFFRHNWNPSAVRHFLSFLRPNNMNITLVSPLCSVFGRLLHQEKYYKTLYKITRISDDRITEWSTKESDPQLELPRPNDLMPEKWEIFTRDDREPTEPHIIHKSSISEIWFMQENASAPDVFIHLEFFSSVVNYGVAERALWRLFYHLLKNVLDDHVHVPQFKERNWMTYDVFASDRGMQMKLHGVNDKLHLLLERVLSRMTTNFEDCVSEDSFNVAHQEYLGSLKREMRKNHSFRFDWCILQYRKNDDDWETDSVFTLEGKLQLADLKKFLRKAFRRIFIRGLVYGNYTKQKALDVIVGIIEKSFSSSHGLLPQEMMRTRSVDLGDGGSHHFYQMFTKLDELYGNAYLLQLGSNEPSPRETVMSYLLQIIILGQCQKFFIINTESPTQTVCTVVQMFPVRSLVIKVVSDETPQNIDSKLERFLHDVIPEAVKGMPVSDFLFFKNNLEGFFKPVSLQSTSNEHWKEIVNRSYQFDRGQMEVDELRTVEKTDLLKFVKATEIGDMSFFKTNTALLPCEFKSSETSTYHSLLMTDD